MINRGMMRTDLAELGEKRSQHAQSCRENGDNSHQILATLYSDPSHFVFELLQNADDAGATWLSFDLRDSELSVTHDGEPFQFHNVDAITTVGSSTSASDLNRIGRFGVGFKSVFGVTASPAIHSGDYHFEISDYIVPSEVPPIALNGETVIRFPFNHETLPALKASQLIGTTLSSFSPECLLFLKHLREIRWRVRGNAGTYRRLADRKKESSGFDSVVIETRRGDDSANDYWLLYRESVTIKSVDLPISIAYRAKEEGGKRQIAPLSESRLSVYFPTKEETGLSFLVDVPYTTTPNRESIDFQDEENPELTSALCRTFGASVVALRDEELLNVAVLAGLPVVDDTGHFIYRRLSEALTETLLSEEPLLPNASGGFSSPGCLAMAQTRDLIGIVAQGELRTLFERDYWLHPDSMATTAKMRTLAEYLTARLSILTVSIRGFADKLTDEVVARMSDEWVGEFYGVAAKHSVLFREGSSKKDTPGELRSKAIMRLMDGTHAAPFGDDHVLQVYLPTERESGFRQLKRNITESDGGVALVKLLDISVPGAAAEVRENVLPSMQSQSSDWEVYLSALKRLELLYANCPQDERKEILDSIRSTAFIRTSKEWDDTSMVRPLEGYLPNRLVKAWFEGNDVDTFSIVDERLVEVVGQSVLQEWGCKIGIHATATEEYTFSSHSHHVKGLDGFNPQFDVVGLKYRVSHMTLECSVALWEVLSSYPRMSVGQCITSSNRSRLHEAPPEERWSTAGKLLKSTSWLYGVDETLIETSMDKISATDLHALYGRDERHYELSRGLRMRLDEIREIEDRTGGRFLSKDELSEFEEFRRLKVASPRSIGPAVWQPDCNPEEAVSTQTEFAPKIRKLELGNQTNSPVAEKKDRADDGKAADDPKEMQYNKIRIGKWGERKALAILKEMYPAKSVRWLNQDRDRGRGYDFVAGSADNEIYFEVKSKTVLEPEYVEMTPTQWEWAQTLYDRGEGDRYYLLVIMGAGSRQVRHMPICNPVKEWMGGRLRAQPVRVEL
jgi:hypothetical protein